MCRFPGITHEQRHQLSMKSNSKLSEADKWFAIWDILFPEQPRPATPYLEGSLSKHMRQFREFSQARSPAIIAAEIEAGGQMRAANLEQAILRGLTLLFEHWLAERASLPQLGSAAPSATATSNESPPPGSTDGQPSSNSLLPMHRETPISSVAFLDDNAMIPDNTQQEELFAPVPPCEAQYQAQYEVPSDGFKMQAEAVEQEEWWFDGLDNALQDMDMEILRGIPDVELDLVAVEERSDAAKL